jgi:hypothetical protein
MLLQTAQTSAVEPRFTLDKIHHSQDLDPPRPSTKREENQLLVFERKVLRTIWGPKIKKGVYRRKYNHELDKDFNSPNTLNVTKTSRLRYAGHMIRRFEDLRQKERAKANGRRIHRRPQSIWAD